MTGGKQNNSNLNNEPDDKQPGYNNNKIIIIIINWLSMQANTKIITAQKYDCLDVKLSTKILTSVHSSSRESPLTVAT